MTVIFRNREDFERKIKIIKRGGAAKLHVIADFDRTLTKYFPNQNAAEASTYGLLEKCFSQEDRDELQELFDHYYPLECCVTLTHEKKAKLMDEWWHKYYGKAVSIKFKEKELLADVKRYRAPFRNKSDEFFSNLKVKRIPLLVFSAGVGNVIRESFRLEKAESDIIHLVSNFILFEKGIAAGHTKPLINSFNKNESHVKHEKYREQIKGRKNAILLGDSLGDTTMADGMEHECLLKIGYLNHDVKDRLAAYTKHFDVVLAEDDSMEFVNKILSDIK